MVLSLLQIPRVRFFLLRRRKVRCTSGLHGLSLQYVLTCCFTLDPPQTSLTPLAEEEPSRVEHPLCNVQSQGRQDHSLDAPRQSVEGLSFHSSSRTASNNGSVALSNRARSADGTSHMTSAYTSPASSSTPVHVQLDSFASSNTSHTSEVVHDQGIETLVAGVKVGRKNWVQFGSERTVQSSTTTRSSTLTSIEDNEDRSPPSSFESRDDPPTTFATQYASSLAPTLAQRSNQFTMDSASSRASGSVPGRLLSVDVAPLSRPASQAPLSMETPINLRAAESTAPSSRPVVSSQTLFTSTHDQSTHTSRRQSAPPIQGDADARRLRTLSEETGQDQHLLRSSSSPMSGNRRRQSFGSVPHFAPPSYETTTQTGETSIDSNSVLPKEEEGQESLPPYTSWVHLEGYLPRKMEFSAPGAPATDRSWRRYYFVLHGTSLSVYRGDMSAVVPRSVALDAFQPFKGPLVSAEPMYENETSAANTKPINSSSLVTTASYAAQQVRHAIHLPPHLTRSSSTRRGTSLDLAFAPLSAFADEADASLHDAQRRLMADRSTSHQSGTGAYPNVHALGSDPFGVNLVRTYSLQEAETGLACDYRKRVNVLRIRVGGEQFLLQCADVQQVVLLNEALQAAINVSLDLDVRPMPMFITMPRRSRTRMMTQQARIRHDRMLAAREAGQVAEAQRRSLFETNLASSDPLREALERSIVDNVPGTSVPRSSEESSWSH